MTAPLVETGFAKVNLALHVRRRRGDGYHDIETVFAFCEDGDAVAAAPSEALSLTIGGQFGAGLSATDNLILSAAHAVGLSARFHLEKRLPVASGIGGGSADAAAALRLLARLYDMPIPSLIVQRALGADVPACVMSQTMRGEGVGEALAPVESVRGTPILLINSQVPLSTAAVFSNWDGVDHGPLGCWQNGRNDLETSARALVPEIGALLGWLRGRHDVTCARMSGSGATCFALFESISARTRVARAAAEAFPGYWMLESTLR